MTGVVITVQMAVRSRWTIVLAVLVLWVGLSAAAWSHAHLRQASPGQGATVTETPTEVRLTFSEPVEVGFSTFKVYPLPPADDEGELREAARELMGQVLHARDDADARADAGLAGESRTSADIVILLKDDLEPGPYVVMWRVLSVDTHVTEGFYTFTYAP